MQYEITKRSNLLQTELERNGFRSSAIIQRHLIIGASRYVRALKSERVLTEDEVSLAINGIVIAMIRLSNIYIMRNKFHDYIELAKCDTKREWTAIYQRYLDSKGLRIQQ